LNNFIFSTTSWVCVNFSLLNKFLASSFFLCFVFLLWSVFLSQETRCNTHGHELLEHQFTRVWQHNLNDTSSFVWIFATLERLIFQVGDGNQAALLTDVHAVCVGLIHKTFFQECGRTVTDDTIAFHFPET